MSLFSLPSTEIKKIAAWARALEINGHDRNVFRQDRFGMWIKYSEYGKCSQYGWEIDHIVPQSWGGLPSLENEVATHWKMNRSKGDSFAG